MDLGDPSPMTRLSHFAAGVGIAPATIFGERGYTPRNVAEPQVRALYQAEQAWRKGSPSFNRSISEQGARDLAGEIIHSRHMDELPNIGAVRSRFKPEHITFDPTSRLHRAMLSMPNDAGVTVFGRVGVVPEKATTGMVTHEVSHLLSGHQFHMGGNAAHEWDFARTHLGAVASVNKAEAGELLRHYQRKGVKITP